MLRLCLSLILAAAALAQSQFSAGPDLDAAIETAIKAGQLPGAVLLVGQGDQTLYLKAYGERALVPAREQMTTDTIFDAASVTKVVATTSSIMKLFEQGKVRLSDRVTEYLPKYQGGKSNITVRELLTHFSGLRPDLDLKPEWSGYETGIEKACVDTPVNPAGARFVYSDINFILLGEIVHAVSGKPLNEFAREQIFLPLGMQESAFNPPASWLPRIAPTEILNGAPLRGVVHDPTTRYMGGVAGHAGLFTTAQDLARFCRMMLGQGRLGDVKIFEAATVKKFTEPNTPPHQPILRGLGWDLDSPFSSNRGELFPIGSFGHTGFTGTSIWMDPHSKGYVILLANSVHPKLRPALSPLRGRVATIAARALGYDVAGVTLTGYNETGVPRVIAHNAAVQTGIDVLEADKFAAFQGKRVGLITNQTGTTADGRRSIDAMAAAGVKLTAIFTPEHGIFGKEEKEDIAHGKDEATGIPIWSLYRGKDRRPSKAMLEQIDVLAFDVMDIGARFYTNISTMKYALEEAAKVNLPFYVLDRPNPITGTRVEGPMRDPDLVSFVGVFNTPVRHGMTVGELARMFNAEEKIGAKLEVIPMKGWRRADWFDSTGLLWVNPSPNMRSMTAATLYTALCLGEYSRNYSMGRGTDAPFEQVGAEFIKGRELADALNRRFIPGVRVYPVRFTPAASNLAGKSIEGVRFVITDREAFSTLRLGLELAVGIEKLYPGKIDWKACARLIGSREVLNAIIAKEDPRALENKIIETVKPFLELRAKYLLYQ